MKFNIALVVLLGFATTMSAQIQPRTGETMYGGTEALKKFEAGESRFPPRPNDMWEVGVHGGHFFYGGDVNMQPGYGFGLHLRKSLGYVLSARLDLMTGEARGVNYRALYGPQITNNYALRALRVPAGSTGPARYGLDPLTGKDNPYFLKYRSEYWHGSVEGIVNLGNLLFHQDHNRWNLYGLVGVGIQAYRTYYDARVGTSETGDLYDYKAIIAKHPNADLNTTVGRDLRLSDITGAGTITAADYETGAEKKTSSVDFLFQGKNIADKDRYQSNAFVPIGAGISYRLSKRVNITVEHKVMLADDDLFDGYQWAAVQGFTPNKDYPNYTNARLAFNIGNFAKQEEPLYWQNPLDQPMAQLQKNTQRKPEDMMKDDDNDGVINMLDKEPETPANAPVDTRGRALDSDGDGIKDYMDQETHSPPKAIVNEMGVAPNKPFDCSACGSNWFLPSVHFDNDKYCIKGEYYSDLKNVANVLTKNPKLCIAVTGFTDDGRTGDYNAGLAYNRAKAVAEFLTANYGVDKNRIALKVGTEDNIAKSATSSSFANRRVEIETVACGTASVAAPASAATSGSSSCTPTYTPPVPNSPPNYIESTPVKTDGMIRSGRSLPKR